MVAPVVYLLAGLFGAGLVTSIYFLLPVLLPHAWIMRILRSRFRWLIVFYWTQEDYHGLRQVLAVWRVGQLAYEGWDWSDAAWIVFDRARDRGAGRLALYRMIGQEARLAFRVPTWAEARERRH